MNKAKIRKKINGQLKGLKRIALMALSLSIYKNNPVSKMPLEFIQK